MEVHIVGSGYPDARPDRHFFDGLLGLALGLPLLFAALPSRAATEQNLLRNSRFDQSVPWRRDQKQALLDQALSLD